MSGINSVASTPNLLVYLQNQQSSEEQAIDGNVTLPTPPTEAQRDARLDQLLSAAGIDEETAAAIKSELKGAFDELQKSGQFPPDRDAMKATVDQIFSKYGLDAESIFGKRSGGPPPSILDAGANAQSPQQLIDLITKLAQDGSSPTDLAQLLTDALGGIDMSA